MFLRVKKKKLSEGRTSYSFSLVESYRKNGKVKQRTVKYLTSQVDEYIETSRIPEDAPEKIKQDRRDSLARQKVNGRLFTWLNIYQDLQEVTLDAKTLSESLDKIRAVVPFPTRADLLSWANHERYWQAAFYGNKHRDETEDNIARMTAAFDEMCSAYCSAEGTDQ